MIRLPGQLVLWKPGVNSAGAFFFFWRVEIKCRGQRGGGEGLSCEDGESWGKSDKRRPPPSWDDS